MTSEIIISPLEADLRLKYDVGDVVFYNHPDYDLKLIGRVIGLFSYKPDHPDESPLETQTMDNSFALIHQMDWIELSHFDELKRITVPGILEFVDTNRSIEVPLHKIIRHLPSHVFTESGDYTKTGIPKVFDAFYRKLNPVITRHCRLCDWDASLLLNNRFLGNVDDIVPACEPHFTILWTNADLTDPLDWFYRESMAEILPPLATLETRRYLFPNLWEDIVNENPKGLKRNRRRNRKILELKEAFRTNKLSEEHRVTDRTEKLVDPRAYAFLVDIVHDLKAMKEKETPAAVVKLFIDNIISNTLPNFIDMIDTEVDALTADNTEEKPVTATFLDSDDEISDDGEEPTSGRLKDEPRHKKPRLSLIEEEAEVGEEEEEEDEEEEDNIPEDEKEEILDSDDDTVDSKGSPVSEDEYSVYSDKSELEDFF